MRPLARAALATLLGVSLGVGVGCAKREMESTRASAPPPPAHAEAPVATCAPSQAVVDAVLFAFLSKASAVHHMADLDEQAKDTKAALAALDELANGLHPGGATPPPEVAEVLADTRARLAELRSRDGAIEAALADVEAGLAFVPGPSHFRGRLFEVKGVVLERQMDALRARGDEVATRRVRGDAIAAFGQAIEIQNTVIAEALRDAGVADADAPAIGAARAEASGRPAAKPGTAPVSAPAAPALGGKDAAPAARPADAKPVGTTP